ncbi:tetratricopeptide repeat protein [Polystyrenella longa]|uniref:Tetratricopeptide repeat protein n=1 Tax=Polystyrenella longa TaxID=2528007 RepID=A0A518CIW7_9PLAN|nr:DUF1583 domain-containing protein [Polystyrenella longa]QDU79161.1 tetratricopeptide repeat protein [Polystyrenella longa]
MPVLNRLIRVTPLRFSCSQLTAIVFSTALFLSLTSCGVPARSFLIAEEPPVEELSEEEQRQNLIMERYLSILERNPQQGTAFSRIYSMYVEQGRLDEFVESYQDKVEQNPEDGAAWKVLGLIESQRGQEAEASKAYEKAEELRPEDASASYYLGQSLLLQGQQAAAVEAFERAIKRNPPANELLEVYQSLGKVYQRMQETEKALEVWKRLDEEFPNSQRVQEQIAITLVEESEFEEALKRYQQMEKETTDDYRKVTYGIKVAEMQLKLAQREEALAQFETLMNNLNPSSWLYRQVRDRIENIFLRNSDQAGLAAYYEQWLEKNPRDIDAMARLSQVHFQQDREEDSEKMLRKAIELAPSDTDLRNRLISQLIQSRENEAAIAEYKKLNEIEPNNPETIRDWGFLIVLDRSQKKAERQAAATAVWEQILKERSDDPVIVSQVADWHREAEMEDKAIALYKKAIELAPENVQYREYLGEYYHQLERKEEALATWKELVAGENRTTRNLIRLAEVLRGFGYQEEGLAYMEEACQDDVEYADRLNYSRMLMEDEQAEPALAQLDLALPLAENDEERHNILRERIRVFQVAETLVEKRTQLQKELEDEANQTSEKWTRLALYYEAEGNADESYNAVREALKYDDLKLPTLVSAARIAETVGDLGGAVTIQERMLTLDRKSRPDYLRQLSQLELQLGHPEKAIDYAQQLIAASPGSVEGYLFYANLCFELGREDEGFKTLRKAVRLNPNDQETLFALAGALSRHYRSEDAIELYWNAFDKADDLDTQIQVMGQLTSLYQRMGKFEELVERVKSKQQSQEGQREINMVLAFAYKSVNDFQNAREILEGLLEAETPDPRILEELVDIAESANEMELAIRYMTQLKEVVPSERNEFRLLQMQLKNGDIEQLDLILTQLTVGNPDLDEIHQMIDSLIERKDFNAALEVTRKMRPSHKADWELQLKEILLLLALDQTGEAQELVSDFVELDLPDMEYSQGTAKQIEQRKKTYQQRGISEEFRDYTVYQRLNRLMQQPSAIEALVQAWKQNQNSSNYALGMSVMFTRSSGGVSRLFDNNFQTYGNARVLAIQWLAAAYDAEKRDELLSKFEKKWESEPNNFQAIWNRLCLVTLQEDNTAALKFAAQYIDRPEIEFAQFCVSKLHEMSPIINNNRRISYTALGNTSQIQTSEVSFKPVLTDAQLDLLVKSYERLMKEQKGASVHYQQQLIAQLKKHDREEQADEIYQEMYASVNTPQEIQSLLSIEIQNQKYDKSLELMERLVEGLKQNKKDQSWQRYYDSLGQFFPQLMLTLKTEKKMDEFHQLFEIALDLYSDSSGQPNQQAHNPFRMPISQVGSMSQTQSVAVMIQMNQFEHREIKYPIANEILPYAPIQAFYNFFFQCSSEPEQVEKLIATVEKKMAAAAPEQQVYYRLVASSFQWWNNKPESALDELLAAIEQMPEVSYEMREQLAQLYISENEFETALQWLDKSEPDNIKDLQKRELAALDIAISGGIEERARVAAERLSSMRLDFNTQLELSRKMKTLGMEELAAVTLKRSRQQAGSNSNNLFQLMTRYQTHNPEIASEIAMQILQNTTLGNQRNSNQDVYRQQAVRILQSQNRLAPLIEETEEKLKASPKSIEIMEHLQVYLEASGKRQRSAEIEEQILKLKPLTKEELVERAERAANAGQYNQSIKLFEQVFKESPEIIGHRFYSMGRAFREANQLQELVDLLEGVELKSKIHSNDISNLMQQFRPRNNTEGDAAAKQAVRLIAIFWDSLKNERLTLLNSLASIQQKEEFWQNKQLKKYLQEAFLPNDVTTVRQNTNYELQQIHLQNYDKEGKTTSLYSHLLNSFEDKKEMLAFRDKVAEKVGENDFWINGKLVLCLLDVKLGRTEDAKKDLDEIKESSVSLPDHIKRFVAQVLEESPELRDDAISIYEELVANPTGNNNSDFRYRPENRLLHLYLENGQKSKGVQLLVKELNRPMDHSSNADYQTSREISRLQEIANQFEELDMKFEAYVLNQRMLMNTSKLERASRYLGSTFVNRLQEKQAKLLLTMESEQVQKSLESDYILALAGQRKSDFPFLVEQILATNLDESGDMELSNPFLDQLTESLDPKSDSKSMNIQGIKEKATRKDRIAATRKVLEIFNEYLKTNELEQPEEPTWLLARLLLQTLDPKFSVKTADLEILQNYLAAISVSDKKPGLENTSDENIESKKSDEETVSERSINLRTDQKKQVIFSCWVLAEALWKDETSLEQGDALSESALNNIRKMISLSGENSISETDREAWLMSLLRSRGAEYLRRGNKEAAEKDWREVLDLLISASMKLRSNVLEVLINPRSAIPTVASSPKLIAKSQSIQIGSQNKTEKEEKAEGKSEKKNTPKPLEYDRFEKVFSLALLMAREGMPELSLEAVGKAIDNGIPLYKGDAIVYYGNTNWSRIERLTLMTEGVLYDKLVELEGLWREQGVPLADIYRLYLSIIFPASEPEEMYVCHQLPIQLPSSNTAMSGKNPHLVFPSFQYDNEDSNNQEKSGSAQDAHAEVSHDAETHTGNGWSKVHGKEYDARSLMQRTLLLSVEMDSTEQFKEVLNEKLSVESQELAIRTILLELATVQDQFEQVGQQLDLITPLLEEKLSTKDVRKLCSVLVPLIQASKEVDKVIPIYEAAIDSLETQHSPEPASSALEILGNYYIEQNELPKLLEAFSKLMKHQQNVRQGTVNSQFGIQTYSLSSGVARMFATILKHTDIDTSMEYLAVLYDAGNGRVSGLRETLTRLYYKLKQLSPEERYPLLHDWVFVDGKPNADLRHFSEFMPADFPPGRFMKVTTDDSDHEITVTHNTSNVFDTTQLLWESALEIGKDQELLAEFQALSNNHREINFQNYLLGLYQNPQSKQVYFETLRTEMQEQLLNQRNLLTPEMMAIAMDALVQSELHEEAKELIDVFRVASSRPSAANRENLVRSNAFQWEHAKLKQPAYQHSTETALPYWVSTTQFHFAPSLEGAFDAAFYGQNEYIKHEASSGDSFIFFKYPLTGDFEFSMETLNDRWSEGHFAYGGLTYQLELGSSGEIWGMGRQGGAILSTNTLERAVFNEFKLKVTADNVKMFMNDEEFSNEDHPSQTSPWIGLFSEDAVRSYFRNLKLTGDITIPDQVDLVGPSGMRGWVGSWLQEEVENVVPDYPDARESNRLIPDEIWVNQNGVLTGKQSSTKISHATMQSYLYYHRPLLDKDVVTYEFFYEKGKIDAHPALGRMAFLIEPDEVRLHWIIQENETHWSGLEYDNSAALKEGEQLTDKIPLKEGEWNQLRFELNEGKIRLTLNHEPIVEIVNEQEGIPHFGFFHYKNLTELKARNIVLTGDWPESLTAEEVLKMMTTYGSKLASPDDAAQQATPVASLIPEEIIFDHVEDILNQSRQRDPEAAYLFLKKWVVPNVEHDTFRLYPAVVGMKRGKETSSTEEVNSVRYLDAPVFDLIEQAELTGKLNELINEANSLTMETPNQKISQTGFLILSELSRDNAEAIDKLLPQFLTELDALTDPEFFWNQWPGVVVYKALKEQGTYAPELEQLAKAIEAVGSPSGHNEFSVMRDPVRWNEAWDHVTSEDASAEETSAEEAEAVSEQK